MSKLLTHLSVFITLTVSTLALAEDASLFSTDMPLADDSNNFAAPQLDKPESDLPSSVTVITRQQISALGFTNAVDALRLVPGMSVTQAGTSRLFASYHGTNSIVPRRMDVLVDGMSLNRVGYSTVYWNSFPLAIDDIERIEVTRNPDDPKYGAHSFQATINFISRHPADVLQNNLEFSGTSDGLGRESVLARGRAGKTSFYARFENTEDSGFDKSIKHTIAGVSEIKTFDAQDDKKATFRANTEFNPNVSFDLSGGLAEITMVNDTRDTNAIGPTDERLNTKHLIAALAMKPSDVDVWNVKGYINSADRPKSWITCYPTFFFTDELRTLSAANPAYANAVIAGKKPTGGTPEDDALANAALVKLQQMGATAMTKQCGTANENFNDARRSINVEHSHAFTENLNATSGIEYQNNYYNSQTQVGGQVKSESYSVYSTAQYNYSTWLTLNAGATFLDTTIAANSFVSPHFGLNFHISPNHTIKFVYSKAVRTPDILEKYVNWQYYMEDFSNPFDGKTGGYFFRHTVNPDPSALRAESYRSYEISASGYFDDRAIEYDVRLFREKFADLISQDVIFTNFNLTNDSNTLLTGGEFELLYSVNPNLKASIGASYVDNDSTNINETTLHTPLSGFSTLVYTKGLDSLSLAYYGEKELMSNSFDRVEAAYKRGFSVRGLESYYQIKLRYQTSDYVATLGKINGAGTGRDGNKTMISNKDAVSVLFKAGLLF